MTVFGRRRSYEPRHALPVTHSTERRSTFMVLLAMLLSSGMVVGTSASFDASNTDEASRFAMATLDRPTNLSGEMAGTAASLQWLAAAGVPGVGYNVHWGDGGQPSTTGAFAGNCSTATYSKIADTSGFSYSDTSANARGATPAQGRYSCYKAETVYPYPVVGTPWTSQLGNPTKSIQTGFVVATVAVTNVTTSQTMASGDIITITFNQPVNITTSPATTTAAVTTPATGSAARVCTISSNGSEAVLIGSETLHSANCAAGDTVKVGRLTWAGNRIDRNIRYTTTWDWLDASCPTATACRVLNVTLGAKVNPSSPANLAVVGPASDAWTFTPVATLLSATGAVAVCVADPANGRCQPLNTGGF